MGMFLEAELTQVAIELPTLSLPIAAESPPCRTLNNNKSRVLASVVDTDSHLVLVG
jgi:hypothetical protein